MYPLVNSTEVRKHWSEFVDEVIRKKPSFVKRNRDVLAVLSFEQMESLLDAFRLKLEIYEEADGSFTGIFEQLDLTANSTSMEALIETLLDDLVEYASEYMENFELYFKSPNRKSHFPYIYKVISTENEPEKLREDIEIYQIGKDHA
jgi:hypothetical protein